MGLRLSVTTSCQRASVSVARVGVGWGGAGGDPVELQTQQRLTEPLRTTKGSGAPDDVTPKRVGCNIFTLKRQKRRAPTQPIIIFTKTPPLTRTPERQRDENRAPKGPEGPPRGGAQDGGGMKMERGEFNRNKGERTNPN